MSLALSPYPSHSLGLKFGFQGSVFLRVLESYSQVYEAKKFE